MCGEDVHPNQKSPMGRMNAPIIIGGSRSSGASFPPCLANLRAKLILFKMARRRHPIRIPTKRERKGRLPIPGLQRRCSWKDMGYASKKR